MTPFRAVLRRNGRPVAVYRVVALPWLRMHTLPDPCEADAPELPTCDICERPVAWWEGDIGGMTFRYCARHAPVGVGDE